jgi:alpha-L-rhamnosidase
MNSLNHSPFTHISEYFYAVLAGIRLGDDPATEHVIVAPSMVDDLDWVSASVETPNGDLAVDWEREDGDEYRLTVTVPWNVTATVRLPAAAGATVTESGESLAVDQQAGVEDVRADGDDVVVDIGAGEYAFTVA